MKKQIIFVDDDPLVLQGLQRMLRHMREQWEMEFVTSGPAALERMAQHSFDVVVSDMMMPGRSGAELLNEVMQRYPQTIHLILSGHADKELIMRWVGATHQYLSKPCTTEDMVQALTAGLKQYHLITAERELLEKTLTGTIKLLTEVLTNTDARSFGLGQRIRDYMRLCPAVPNRAARCQRGCCVTLRVRVP